MTIAGETVPSDERENSASAISLRFRPRKRCFIRVLRGCINSFRKCHTPLRASLIASLPKPLVRLRYCAYKKPRHDRLFIVMYPLPGDRLSPLSRDNATICRVSIDTGINNNISVLMFINRLSHTSLYASELKGPIDAREEPEKIEGPVSVCMISRGNLRDDFRGIV